MTITSQTNTQAIANQCSYLNEALAKFQNHPSSKNWRKLQKVMEEYQELYFSTVIK